MSQRDFDTGYVTPNLLYKNIVGDKVVKTFYSTWFKNVDTDTYTLSFNVTKPMLYVENGIRFLNTFSGFKYANEKVVNKYTRKENNGIELIWNHVKDVLCSGNHASYEYLKKWICHMIAGRKMKTAVYFKGVQGTGKSTLPTFLRDVIGHSCVYKTQTASCLTSQFNGELQGVILLILEELNCKTISEWKAMNSALKVLCTENTLTIQAKHQNAFNVTNNISVMIISNDSPIKINKHDRRYFMTDISDHRVGDKDYFDKLYGSMNDAAIQKAFYFQCLQFASENEFDEQADLRTLETSIKTEIMINNLHPLYVFVKEQFILKKRDLNTFLKSFTDDYNATPGCKHQLSNAGVARLMREAGISCKASTGNRMRFKTTHDE